MKKNLTPHMCLHHLSLSKAIKQMVGTLKMAQLGSVVRVGKIATMSA
jgi:hypothetical protein